MVAGCIVHCNKVSKPFRGKHLLLCMNSNMHFLLISYTLIMFLKVLRHFIMKIKKIREIFLGDYNHNTVGENGDFQPLHPRISRKTYVMRLRLVLTINRKSHIVDLM